MKKLTVLWVYTALFLISIASAQQTGHEITEIDYESLRTQELNDLYEEAKLLENASPQEINANRLAIKNAWAAIDPDIANLYKPVAKNIVEEDFVVEMNTTSNNQEIPPSQNRRWADDIQIHDLRIDGGIDIVAFNNGGALYATSFNNSAGGGNYHLNIFQSFDMGETWQHFRTVTSGVPYQKARALTLEAASGDQYLLIYYINGNNSFRVFGWNLSQGEDFDDETITGDVIDFEVDRNWTGTTNQQRVFAVYKKTDNQLYSARSTAGDYGFNWVDETYLNNNRGNVDIAYSRSGGIYVVMVSDVTNSMYVRVNDNYNDPASWSTSDLLENGADRETFHPTIRAERLSVSEDNVLVVASSRDAGTSGKFNLRWYRRSNGSDFDDGTTEGSPAGLSYLYFDSFINYSIGADINLGLFQLSLDNQETNKVFHRRYSGTSLGSYNLASNEDFGVFGGFLFKPYSLTAIQNGDEPLMVFCGTSGDETFAEGLYFDRESNTLGTSTFDENEFIVYPNPVDDILQFKFPQSAGLQQISVADVTGKQLIKQIWNDAQDRVSLDISHFQVGTYFISLTTENGTLTKKIVKK
ncbi:MAG: T9SS type A sorting domain-containing protein [Bacteroidota bacterium]